MNKKIEEIVLPEEVKYIIDELNKFNYEAYIVGGCVRDFLLNKKINDYDITTSAKPLDIKRIFSKTFDSGIKHGTISVIINNKVFEVTTFRIDGEYLDNRHPKEVVFTSSIKEDLRRRDFTINAMAYNYKTALIDYFNGVNDLNNKIIRCVGDPEKRFEEDGLRILRAIRFSAELGFNIEEKTKEAIKEKSYLLENISKERIRDELIKIIMSDNPDKLILASELGVTKYFLPEFDLALNTLQETPYHYLDVGRHSIEAIKHSKKDLIIRLSLLLHDLGKPLVKTYNENGIARFYNHALKSKDIAINILDRLKFPKAIINKVSFLVLHHSDEIIPKPKYVRRAIRKIGVELFPYYLEIQRCDVLAQSNYKNEEVLKNNALIRKQYEDFIKENACFSLKDLKVNGNDLIKLGYEGKKIGHILKNMLNKVIDEPELNDKEYLLKHIKDFL